MDIQDLIVRNFQQMWGAMDRGLVGLTREELVMQPRPHCNSIGWIAWHMLRVEDWWFHSVLQNTLQLWQQGWAERMGLPAEPRYTGARMKPEEVAAFPVPGQEEIAAYDQLLRKNILDYVGRLTPADLDREVDTVFGRRMTVGEIFSHLFCEMNQHAGQISYLRGYVRGYLGHRV